MIILVAEPCVYRLATTKDALGRTIELAGYTIRPHGLGGHRPG